MHARSDKEITQDCAWDQNSRVRLEMLLKWYSSDETSNRHGCSCQSSTKLSSLSWFQIDREGAFLGTEAFFADIVVYNSSPNFPLPCILLSHWLQVIADVFFSQNSFHTARFWIADRSRYMANISRASATWRRFSQIVSLIIHTAWMSLAWTSTDLPLILGICRWFRKPCQWVKIGAKIVQCELGIALSSVWCHNAFLSLYNIWFDTCFQDM